MVQRTRTVRMPRRQIPDEIADRVPPGQIVTPRWPILHQGDVPSFDRETWDFRVWGLVRAPQVWTWDQMQALPMSTVDGDLHCVTRWSTLDHTWTGLLGATLAEIVTVDETAHHVLLHGESGYTANLTLAAFLREDTILATQHDGLPLTPEHGAPLRAVLPAHYAWKSVKWLRGVEFLAEDCPGFWEGYGYSNSADPWLEERFES